MSSIQAPKFEGNFLLFLSQVENYNELVDTKDEKKPRLILHLLGSHAQKIMEYLKPKNISDMTYEEVIEACKSTFIEKGKQQSSIAFFSTNQKDEKSVDFALKLKELAQQAEIVGEQIVVDRIIAGLKDNNTKYELMKDKINSFLVLIERLKFLEQCATASKNCTVESTSVDAIKFKNNKNNTNKRYGNSKNENKKGKKQNKKVKKNECFYCKKLGHWKKDCTLFKNKNKQVDQITNDLGNIDFYRNASNQN
jgi:hypothetical protein